MSAPEYLPRSWWADSDWKRGGAQLVEDDLWRLGNVCHYPGRAKAFGEVSLAALRNTIRGWWDYHVNGRGWSDIGYQVAVALTTDGPVVVDLRGIGRVPAAHASTSNPRANWHGGATLWVIGNTEKPEPELIDAYRHFRHNVWLPRWPSAKGVTHHRRVPGASTACAGDYVDELVTSGALTRPPSSNALEDDDMKLTDKINLVNSKTGKRWWPGEIMGTDEITVAGALGYAAASLYETNRNDAASAAREAKMLSELAAIRQALNADPVDEGELARQIAELLTPAVVAELGDRLGLTREDVETAVVNVLRRGVGS